MPRQESGRHLVGIAVSLAKPIAVFPRPCQIGPGLNLRNKSCAQRKAGRNYPHQQEPSGAPPMKYRMSLAVAALALGLAAPALAQANKPVRIAVIQDSTGPLQAYAQQVVTGWKLGLE